jgi:hypothetical protein
MTLDDCLAILLDWLSKLVIGWGAKDLDLVID